MVFLTSNVGVRGGVFTFYEWGETLCCVCYESACLSIDIRKLKSHNTENCGVQKKDQVSEQERLERACKSGTDYGKRMFSFLSH